MKIHPATPAARTALTFLRQLAINFSPFRSVRNARAPAVFSFADFSEFASRYRTHWLRASALMGTFIKAEIKKRPAADPVLTRQSEVIRPIPGKGPVYVLAIRIPLARAALPRLRRSALKIARESAPKRKGADRGFSPDRVGQQREESDKPIARLDWTLRIASTFNGIAIPAHGSASTAAKPSL